MGDLDKLIKAAGGIGRFSLALVVLWGSLFIVAGLYDRTPNSLFAYAAMGLVGTIVLGALVAFLGRGPD